MKIRPVGAGKSRAGYALPVVLTVLAVLSLVFMAAIAALTSLRNETRAALDAAEFQRGAMSAEAHAAYLASTEPLGPDRLRVGGQRTGSAASASSAQAVATMDGVALRLDGRPYVWRTAGGKTYALSLQDAAGLMNLDFSRRDTLMRLFQRAGTNELAAQTAADQLLDYVDADSQRRPQGAEAPEYASVGRAGPLNAPMSRLQDVFGVLDWPRVIDAARWRRIAPLLSADPASGAFNVNTAPSAVLQIVLNMTQAQADQVIARRAQAPVTSLTQLGLTSSDAAVSYTSPNGRFRLAFTDPVRQVTYTTVLTLTPEDDQRPFRTTGFDVAKITPDTAALLKGANALPFPDPFNSSPHP